MDKEKMFRNFTLSDEEVIGVIKKYMPVINKHSVTNVSIDEDCKQEIMLSIFKNLTKNRKK